MIDSYLRPNSFGYKIVVPKNYFDLFHNLVWIFTAGALREVNEDEAFI